MSRRARTPENFPRMKVRGGRRRNFERLSQQRALLLSLPWWVDRFVEEAQAAFAAAVDAALAAAMAAYERVDAIYRESGEAGSEMAAALDSGKEAGQ